MNRSEITKYIQRRWKEIVQDLAVQRGINAELLFKKVPAFSAGDPGGDPPPLRNSGILFMNLTKDEIRVLKTAADVIADVILSVIPDPSLGLEGHRA